MRPRKPGGCLTLGFYFPTSKAAAIPSGFSLNKWPWVKTAMGSHFGVGAPPILGPILVGIESDVHWGYGLWILTHGQTLQKGAPIAPKGAPTPRGSVCCGVSWEAAATSSAWCRSSPPRSLACLSFRVFDASGTSFGWL